MPIAKKQSAQPAVARNGPVESVLDRIAPVQAGTGGIKLCVYGRPKSGKTRVASSFPKPMLIIGTEDGTKSVSTVKGLDFVRIHTAEEFTELTNMLRGGKYKSAALDTAGGLQDIILKEILGLDDIPVQRSWGMAQREHWMACGAQFKERMNPLFNMADQQGLNVIVIAHERNFNEESTSDVMLPTVGAALTPSAAGYVNRECDYICQTYIREAVVEKKTVVAGKETMIKTHTGRKEYCLRVGPHEIFLTGFRLPPGAELPDSLVNPDYTKIATLIAGK